MTRNYQHAWRLWNIDLPVVAEGWLELCCRCWDNSMNTQPTDIRTSWNWDFHVISHVHRVRVYSVNRTVDATRRRLQQLTLGTDNVEPITKPLTFALDSGEQSAEKPIWPREPED
jgi:sulfite oxidase